MMKKLGIYEKALPDNLNWIEKFKLVKELGFSHLEFSIDESDARLARLDWDFQEKKELLNLITETGIRIQNIMLSGHRRYPLGSSDPEVRKKSIIILKKAVDLAVFLGARNIQLAGYDVFYEEKSVSTREYFIEGLYQCVQYASQQGVMLSIETMDDPFINSITKIRKIKSQIKSPWLQAYPDLGNLSAWNEWKIAEELEHGIETIVSIHLKDTLKVTNQFPGKFNHVPFGEGVVDFKGCLRTLKRLDYSGSFTIELWNDMTDHPVEEIKKSKQFFDSIFNQLDWFD